MIMGKEGWIRYRSFLMSKPGRGRGVVRARAKLRGIKLKTKLETFRWIFPPSSTLIEEKKEN